MLKIKSIFVSLLAVAALASCSNENDDITDGGEKRDYDVAYMSVSVAVPQGTRTRAAGSSGETDALDSETKIKELYLVLFDDQKKVVKADGATAYYTILGESQLSQVDNAPVSPLETIKVSTESAYLLTIANPGAKLKALLNGIVAGNGYADINKEFSVAEDLAEDDNSYLIAEVADLADKGHGCTMINAGAFDDLISDEWNADCLVDVAASVVKASDYKTDTEAKEAAKGKKATIQIERLASKLAVTLKGDGLTIEIVPSTAKFEFKEWTIDYVNSRFFPFATKTKLTATHTGAAYKSNFYTEDPNFDADGTGKHLVGIISNKIVDYNPKAKWYKHNLLTVAKEEDKNVAYCTENTMAAADQDFGAATRLVLKAVYTPYTDFDDDWYQTFFNGTYINYKNLGELQTAYNDATDIDEADRDAVEKLLVESCDKFINKLNSAFPTAGLAADFKDLTQQSLDDLTITNGGEVAKETGIRWFQKSLNYYYYQIRHDNTTDIGHMAYGKYGVVRNNYYTLNLTKVNGAGTPWYPDVEEPEEEIDKKGAYLHFEIEVAPWISWGTDFEI